LLCGEIGRQRLFAKNGYPIAKCSRCQLIYVDRTLGKTELARVYGSDYFTGDVFRNYLAEREERLEGARGMASVLARVQSGGRLLDIGCAAGFFLEAASRFYDVTGVELSEFAARHARNEFGHRVVTGDITELDFGDELFDVVTLWNTVEHLADPLSTLRKTATLSRPGALLVLTTGNVAGPLARRDLSGWNLMHPPEHLFYFSPRTIERLLARSGFELRRIVFDGLIGEGGIARSGLVQRVASVLGLGNVMTVYARRAHDPAGLPNLQQRWLGRLRPIRAV